MRPHLPLRAFAVVAATIAVASALALPVAANPHASTSKSLTEIENAAGRGRHVTLPADAGVIDAQRDFGAAGDGVTDDTAALRAAVAAASGRPGSGRPAVVYLPPGDYLITDTIEWRTTDNAWTCCVALRGSGEDATSIRLSDGAAGFGDPEDPKAMLFTASSASGVADGAGNEAFRNNIQDLTVDTGRDNPGAVGIDWLANNVGAIRFVTVRSGDGSGSAGIAMTRRWPGPGLLSGVTIEGFAVGIALSNWNYGITMEHVTLRGQQSAGIRNDRNVVSIRGLVSDNAVPAVLNTSASGVVTILDADLRGGTDGSAALSGPGAFSLNDVRATGYSVAFAQRPELGRTIDAAASPGQPSASDPAAFSIEVHETPHLPYGDPAKWTNVQTYGASPRDGVDDTVAIQAALDSGESTVYLPPGGYLVNRTLRVPPAVSRIISFGGWFDSRLAANDPAPTMRVSWSEFTTPLFIEGLTIYSASHLAAGIEHASSRALVLIDGETRDVRSTAGAGTIYIEDVVARLDVSPGQSVFARQLNTETPTGNVNAGGSLWVLGLKTERPLTAITTTSGGRTELQGGVIYPAGATGPIPNPAFRAVDAQHVLTFATTIDRVEWDYTTLVQNEGNSAVLDQLKGQIPLRSGTLSRVAIALTSAAPSSPPPEPDPAPQPTSRTARYVPLASPQRLLDTRRLGDAGYVRPGETISQRVAGMVGVPSDATAVALNLTGVEAGGEGFVTVWPNGGARPDTSSLNFTEARQQRANFVIVPLGHGGAIDIYAQSGAHVIADVAGYFVSAAAASDGRFVPISPTRVLDTRTGTGAAARKPTAGETVKLQVAGRGTVPDGAAAVALNLTGADATAGGFVTAWPSGAPRPDASNLNLGGRGATAPNLVVVPVGTDGAVDIYTEAGTHLIADLVGYFTGGGSASSAEGLFVPVPPQRVLDTRATAAIAPAGVLVHRHVGSAGVPDHGVGAVVLNVTATEVRSAGYVSAWPIGLPMPNASVLNLSRAGDTRANAAILPVGTSGSIAYFSETGTHLIADTSGYFTATGSG
jgi:hypothetical protein